MMQLLRILFYLFLITLPLGTRTIVYQFTAGFHEYETASIYASDLFLILFLLFSVKSYFLSNPPAGGEAKDYIAVSLRLCSGDIKRSLIAVFLFFAFLSIFFATSTGLAINSFARLLLLVAFALAAERLLSDKKVFQKALAIIAVLAVIQSGIGFLQFKNQSALGLKLLGESPISITDGATSKILVGGVRVLRAYGTFPHPNILAAFLILGLIGLYYFWLRRPSEWKIFSSVKNLLSDLIWGAGIFAVSFGLMISFSRVSWLIAAIITFSIIIFSVFKKNHFIQAVRLGVLTLAIAGILLLNFKAFILPRAAVSLEEPAVTQRLAYNDIGLYLIKNNPFGVGIGNQVLYSVENKVYEKFGMDKLWQWQPIHNIYLLIGSEVGILGLFSFIAFLISLFLNFKSQASNSKQITNSNNQDSKKLALVTSYLLLIALLFFGFFDHFLWTIQQGRLMLWLAIGLVLAVAKKNTPS